jgi:hypothetical protein
MNLQPRGNYEPEMKQGVDHDGNAFEVKPICALSTFLMFWKKNYPHLRLKKPAEDVCTYCYQFHHKFRYIRHRVAERNKAAAFCGEDDDDDDITSPHNSSIQCYYIDSDTKSKTNVGNDTIIPDEVRPVNYSVPAMVDEIDAIVGVREDLIVHAALHVNEAAGQRSHARDACVRAQEDKAANKTFSESVHSFVIDYGQNAAVPHLGSNQAGDAYYMSPLKIFNLGIVDCSVLGGDLHIYPYHEGLGKKGGNNVASTIMDCLQSLGMLRENEIGKELNIIMDNCGGQNKNNHVLRLANLLVEAGYFRQVNFIFYVVGHTKNICDRWFNTLKKIYRRENIYTFDQLCASWTAANNKIKLHEVTDTFFKRYYEFENLFYKTIDDGECSPGHVFTVDESRPTTMIIHRNRLGTYKEHEQDMKINNGKIKDEDRISLLRSRSLLKTIPFPGIAAIKQIELFKKWRKVVPPGDWKDICPEPSVATMAKFKLERQAKGRMKYAEKKEQKQEEEGKEEFSSPKQKKKTSSKKKTPPKTTPKTKRHTKQKLSGAFTARQQQHQQQQHQQQQSQALAAPAVAPVAVPAVAPVEQQLPNALLYQQQQQILQQMGILQQQLHWYQQQDPALFTPQHLQHRQQLQQQLQRYQQQLQQQHNQYFLNNNSSV